MKRYAFEGILAAVFLVALFLVVLLQILGRTGIVPGPIWTEELARWLWVWMALIGIGAVERNRAHLRMGFLIELLPGRGQRLVALLTHGRRHLGTTTADLVRKSQVSYCNLQ